ncbi:MAG: FAD-binding protein [Deltaproteobacteria bacterium]|nr:FAD-binding protein [Deltaproteobacteria bacterium]
MPSWDEEVDFLVVGSGAGGMVAALRAHDLGCRTLVVEKAPVYGGSSAISGGVVWVPANHLMAGAGIEDSPEAGLRYLEKITAGSSSPEKLRAYVDTAPRMLEYLDERSHIGFDVIPGYPDYYPEEEGGKTGGRSCEPRVFDAGRLGDEFRRQNMHPKDIYIFGFMTGRATDGKDMMRGGLKGALIILREALLYFFNLKARFKRLHNTRCTLGGALVASARASLLDRGVPVWLDTKLEDLVEEEGRITGAVVTREGEPLRIAARRGVLLAAGGFERNEKLREQYQRGPTGSEWTAGTVSNTGDTVAIGQRLGAAFDLLEDAWWCPVFRAPFEEHRRILIFERSLPGGIVVNSLGRRFMNEAAPYNDAVKRIYAANSQESQESEEALGASTIPSYLIFDRRFRRKYPIGPIFPANMQPDWATGEKAEGFLERADTLEGLAAKLGVDAAGLRATVERFNDFARSGKDEDFGRGESAQDRYYTIFDDAPNPNLATIEKAPYYGCKLWPGDLGTKGGLRTDLHARVMREQGDVIPGLYATGNCSAAVMGHTYPGAGGTLGPAMTFGFRAAEHAGGEAEECAAPRAAAGHG